MRALRAAPALLILLIVSCHRPSVAERDFLPCDRGNFLLEEKRMPCVGLQPDPLCRPNAIPQFSDCDRRSQ